MATPGTILLAPATLLATGYFLRRRREGWAFLMTSVTITATLITCFLIMYPRVMISSLNPAWSLTIDNAASSPYTLTVMTIVALIFVPIILVYQGWTYWVFRKRLETKVEGLTY
jgi:cytochrome d ubiquinol oxidase subunit II